MNRDNNRELEAVILECLRRQLGGETRGDVPQPAVEAVRAVLEEPQLTHDELHLTEALGGDRKADLLGTVLSLRLERAVRAGLELLEGAEKAETVQVFALRKADDSPDALQRSGRQFNAALKLIRARLQRSTVAGDKRILFIVDGSIYGELCAALREQYSKYDTSLSCHPRQSSRVGHAPHATTLELVEADVQLEDLERSVQRARERASTNDLRRTAIPSTVLTLESAAAVTTAPDTHSIGSRITAGAVPISGESTGGRKKDPLVGELLHFKYRIVRRIGRGGFGAVYEALDERGAGNRVAIKVLTRSAAKSAVQQQSFKEEAHRVTLLSHPNIVSWRVFDETEAGLPYFVMELVEGEELHKILPREAPLDPARVARLLLQTLDALRAAHHLSENESILHLDLKPANIFVIPARFGREEQIKVIDFGIGQYIGEEANKRDTAIDDVAAGGVLEPGGESGSLPRTLTFSHPSSDASTGAQIAKRKGTDGTKGAGSTRIKRSSGCTPEYASPEQCAHVLFKDDIEALDGRSDLYSLGVIAFEMLSGRLPFVGGKNRLDVVRMHREKAPPTLASVGARVPRKLARFVERCLRKDPDDRWRDTQEAYQSLHRIVNPPVAVAVAKVTVPLLLIGALIGGYFYRERVKPVNYVQLVEQDGGQAVTELYLGPQRTAARFELKGPDGARPVSTAGTWSIRKFPDGAQLVGWDVALDASGVVRITCNEQPQGRVETRLEVVLDDDRLVSRPLMAIWLGPDTWSVASVEVGKQSVGDLVVKPVDPVGEVLDIWIEGEARKDLAGVVVSVPGRDEPIDLNAWSASDRERYRLDFADIGVNSGPLSLTLTARDKAGEEWSRLVELELVSTALALKSMHILDASGERSNRGELPRANRSGGRYRITDRTLPVLGVRLSRVADLAWSVVVGDDELPVLSGQQLGQTELEIPLEPLTGLNGGEPYSGRIRIRANENVYVLHSADSERGVVDQFLDFAYDSTGPDFRTVVRVAGEERPLREQDVLFLNSARAELLITRLNNVPVSFELAWWRADRPEERQSQPVRGSNRPGAWRPEPLSLELGDDGTYELELLAYGFDAGDSRRLERPDVEQQFRIILDREAPTFRLSGLESGVVMLGDSAVRSQVLVQFDEFGGEFEPGVDLSWSLRRLGGMNTWRAPRDMRLENLDSNAHLIRLTELWGAAGPLDGFYELEVGGRDLAGNPLAPELIEFEVAIEGPDIAVLKPSPTGRWYPEEESWPVVVEVLDPNGVRSVEVSLDAHIPGLEPKTFELKQESDRSSNWLGSVRLSEEYSEKGVSLIVQAVDGRGRKSSLPETGSIELPPINPLIAQAVRVSIAGSSVARLTYVRGNGNDQGFEYTFGGRGDPQENKLFSKAGMQPFHANLGRWRRRSWVIDYPAGEIKDFYLDEREVTVSEYQHFLRAPGGYSSARNWPGMARPNKDRVRTLMEVLEESPGDESVTGVTWDEAAAYAAWVGKRLPTWVEWEYTVRGGANYRPFASYAENIPVPASATREGLMTLNPGMDRTPGGAHMDLCSGVSEWTGSPADTGNAYPHVWAKDGENSRLLLEGGSPNSEHYWVVGGADAAVDLSFARADQRPRGYRDDIIGFRCASSLQNVRSRLSGSPALGEPHFEELQR